MPWACSFNADACNWNFFGILDLYNCSRNCGCYQYEKLLQDYSVKK